MSFFAQVSTKERYALRMMLMLAKTYYSKEPIALSEISREEHISLKYLEQIMIPFKKQGWLESHRGPKGGYLMIKDPKEITLKDIIFTISEDKTIVPCLNAGTQECELYQKCCAKKAWKTIQEALENAMDTITLDALLDK